MLNLLFFTLISFSVALAAPGKVYKSENMNFGVENLVEREDVIWGFDFLPDNKIIFTERSGAMLVYDQATKKSLTLKGVPKVNAVGQGGLLDVRVHPSNQKIYFCYSEPLGDTATTALGVGELKNYTLTNVKKLFSAHKPNDNDEHYGCRIEFDKGFIFLSVGDRGVREKAQDLAYHQGKLLRLNEDGTPAKDNPFSTVKNAKPEIYTYGHRSPQGLMKHPMTGELWETEMGPRGGDEVNVIRPGANYGWPVVTFGREYYGPKIGVPEKKGFEAPIIHWVPSISPSAMAFYSGDKLSAWKGNLFLATLSGQHLHRIVLNGTKSTKQENLLSDLDYRFRNVRQGPDGFLYFSTDEGKLARIINR